jgi:hypothetical protein
MKLQNSTVTPPSTPSQPVRRCNFALPAVNSRAADANEGHNRAVYSANCDFYALNSLFGEIEFPVP